MNTPITPEYIIKKLNEFNIVDPKIQSHFLGQCHYESNGFKTLTEAENYTYTRAIVVWPSRKEYLQEMMLTNKKQPNDFCKQPDLFNYVYALRMGNCNYDDGYNYRGRGLIQITGKTNYTSFLMWVNNLQKYKSFNINNITSFVETNDGAILSAIWFWIINDISKYALTNDYVGVTKKINGGINGLNKRIELTNYYMNLIK